MALWLKPATVHETIVNNLIRFIFLWINNRFVFFFHSFNEILTCRTHRIYKKSFPFSTIHINFQPTSSSFGILNWRKFPMSSIYKSFNNCYTPSSRSCGRAWILNRTSSPRLCARATPSSSASSTALASAIGTAYRRAPFRHPHEVPSPWPDMARRCSR